MDLTRYVGFYRGYEDDNSQGKDPISSYQTAPKSSTIPPGVRAEGGPLILPATAYRRREEEIPIMLDNNPSEWHASQSSGSRSPRFFEHLSDLEAVGSPSSSRYSRGTFSAIEDSPTLGRTQPMPRSPLAEDVIRNQRYGTRNR